MSKKNKKFGNVMLDIETLGTNSNAVVVSISAVEFNLKTGVIGETFEIGLDVQSQINEGAFIDGDTVLWWINQSTEAQRQLLSLGKTDVFEALCHFTSFLEICKPSRLWGNSSTFDNVIVRNLYDRFNLTFPVPFWSDRCVRTYVDMMGINKNSVEFDGTPHCGLDDCKHQIKYMVFGERP